MGSVPFIKHLANAWILYCIVIIDIQIKIYI